MRISMNMKREGLEDLISETLQRLIICRNLQSVRLCIGIFYEKKVEGRGSRVEGRGRF